MATTTQNQTIQASQIRAETVRVRCDGNAQKHRIAVASSSHGHRIAVASSHGHRIAVALT